MKKKNGYWILLLLSAQMTYGQAQQDSMFADITNRKFDPATLLWYDSAAARWTDALPVGNGRLGAMVFGKSDTERIQLNEDTYWTGGPYSSVVQGGSAYLKKVQQLVFDEKWQEAQKLFGRKLMGYPVEQQKYQPLGNLLLFFDHPGKTMNYRRWLDLTTGITGARYTRNGITYHQSVLASVPDQVIVVRLWADRPGGISLTANLRGVRDQAVSATDYFQMGSSGNDELVLTGKSADYLGIKGQLRYECRTKAVAIGGSVTTRGDDLIVRDADTLTLYISAATNFVNYKDVSGDEHARVSDYEQHALSRPYEAILEAHLQNYQRLFDRVRLALPVSENSFLPTNERIKNNISVPDPALAGLSYHFGRYVLISSSRPGTQAANLQGIWNEDSDPAWDSKYTTNINTEMNYWAVETADLSECAEPLIQLVRELTDQGAQVAREHYGSRGWVAHQNTDLWRAAAPMDGPTWGTFTTAGAWLCTQLWEHYQYTGDTAYLRDIYPVIKGCVQFFMDFLVQQPGSKWYVTNPSTSPENFPKRPGNHPFFDEVCGMTIPNTNICAGSSIDMEILHDLFGYFIQAATVLKTDPGFSGEVSQKRALLLGPQIGKDGSLQEWAQDWGQTEAHHRHLSPLYGLYPGDEFSFSKTPGLMDACKAVLEQRGDISTGWSMAWKVPLWARLHDGNRANKILKEYFHSQAYCQFFAKCGSPMQIDGTMGVTAGISEMLVQSQDGVITLLEGLPDEWKEGEFNGVCTRGAFKLDVQWKDHSIAQVRILSRKGNTCKIKVPQKLVVFTDGRKVKSQRNDGGILVFETSPNGVYVLRAMK